MGTLASSSLFSEASVARSIVAVRRHLGPLAALAVSTIMVAFLGAASARDSARPAEDRRGLTARRLPAGDVELHWSANDPKLPSADEAILTIVDGGNERSEYLSTDAIQRGSYVYHRQAWDVWFCLRLFHNGRRFYVDDVRLLDSPIAEPDDLHLGPPEPGQTYIQVAAVPQHYAHELGRALVGQKLPVALEPVQSGTDWYRVLVGPIQSDSELPGTLAEIRQTGLVEGVAFTRKF